MSVKTNDDGLRIIVLCKSFREIENIMYYMQLNNVKSVKEVNYRNRRIVTKNNDVIIFYCRESKLNDGIRADVIAIDNGYPTKFELAILKYSKLYKDSMAEMIWSYQDLNNYLEVIK